MAIENPFVKEVTRIIIKAIMKYSFWPKRTVILVSRRFHKEALDEVEKFNRKLGIKEPPNGFLSIRGLMIALPVPWLSDYEFEIRVP